MLSLAFKFQHCNSPLSKSEKHIKQIQRTLTKKAQTPLETQENSKSTTHAHTKKKPRPLIRNQIQPNREVGHYTLAHIYIFLFKTLCDNNQFMSWFYVNEILLDIIHNPRRPQISL